MQGEDKGEGGEGEEVRMKVIIGSDHGGYNLKSKVISHLSSKGYEVIDVGCNDESSVDYPDYGHTVGEKVLLGEGEFGIVICGTGIGISIAANKVKGVRCALLSDCFSAKMARAHNDANVIALGARVLGEGLAIEILDSFLSSSFEGGRHEKRVGKIEKKGVGKQWEN